MTLNPDLIRARCEEIDAPLSRLVALRPLSREIFLSHKDTLDIARYPLLIAIEATLAVYFDVSAKRLHQVPDDYASCFSSLERAGLITPELPTCLQQIARFPNLLVHVYWKIDYGQVYNFITTRLDDLRAFRTAMVELL